MEPLRMDVTMSNLIDLSSKVVRGLWWKNDFFSDFCTYFEPPELIYSDLKMAVQSEWMIRRSMTEKHLSDMRKAREAYEEELIRKQKEEEEKLKSSKKAKNSGKKETKSKKSSKRKVKFVEKVIPPIVDEATYVDVEDEYVEHENAWIENERYTFAPENLDLADYEVKANARDFF